MRKSNRNNYGKINKIYIGQYFIKNEFSYFLFYILSLNSNEIVLLQLARDLIRSRFFSRIRCLVRPLVL